jgi:hypothetical protein
MMEASENPSETMAPDLAIEATWRRPPHRTRNPRRLFGTNVVAEFIAAGGGPEARERLLRRLRTEGQWDPQIPNFRSPAAAAERITISLEPYWTLGPQGSDRKARARTEAKPTPATKSRHLTPPQAP